MIAAGRTLRAVAAGAAMMFAALVVLLIATIAVLATTPETVLRSWFGWAMGTAAVVFTLLAAGAAGAVTARMLPTPPSRAALSALGPAAVCFVLIVLPALFAAQWLAVALYMVVPPAGALGGATLGKRR